MRPLAANWDGMKRVILLVLFLLPGVRTLAEDIRVTASIDSEVIGIEDQLHLTITVSGRESSHVDAPRIGDVKGFRIVAGPDVSSRLEWADGEAKNWKAFSYVLLPEKEGQFTIAPVEIAVGNRIFRTEPLQVRVTSAPQKRSPVRPGMPRPVPGPENVFVTAELDRDTAYQGQQVTLSYLVYTTISISGIDLQESPPLNGFWVEDLEIDRNPKGIVRIVDGREYRVFTVKKQALFPTSSGRVRIPSSTFALSANTARGFFDFFGRTETVFRRTPELILNVKPIPEKGRPTGFSHAVGSFSLSAKIDKNQVTAGDAVSLRVALEGKGNLKMIPEIGLPSFSGFTVYSPRRSDDIRALGDGRIGGNRIWEYVLVPVVAGEQTIPSVSFAYFDPEREEFTTLSTTALELKVTPGVAEPATHLKNANSADIHPLKEFLGDPGEDGTPLYRTYWFYVIAALPLVFNCGALLCLKRSSGGKAKSAGETAVEQLRLAEKEGLSQPRLFYDRASAALSGYLSNTFNLSEIELTTDGLTAALSQHRVEEDVVQETITCLQECDYGCFVAASGSPEKMRELADRIRKIIDALDKRGKTGVSAGAASIVLLLLFAPGLCLPSHMDLSPEKLFGKGNSEYEKGNYKEAAECYRQLLRSGLESGAVYYNLGNICFREKRLGEAIYYWEKSLQKSPGDREALANLALADSLIEGGSRFVQDAPPARLFAAVQEFFSIEQQSLAALFLFVVTNLFFSVRLLAKDPRRSIRGIRAASVAAILFIVCTATLGWRIYERDFCTKGVVLESGVEVRSAPGQDSPTVSTIYEGTRARVDQSEGEWYRIRLVNGLSGWIHRDKLRIF